MCDSFDDDDQTSIQPADKRESMMIEDEKSSEDNFIKIPRSQQSEDQVS